MHARMHAYIHTYTQANKDTYTYTPTHEYVLRVHPVVLFFNGDIHKGGTKRSEEQGQRTALKAEAELDAEDSTTKQTVETLFRKEVDVGSPSADLQTPEKKNVKVEEAAGSPQTNTDAGEQQATQERVKRERTPHEIARSEATKLLTTVQAKIRVLQSVEIEIMNMPSSAKDPADDDKTLLTRRQQGISVSLSSIQNKLSVAIALKERATVDYLKVVGCNSHHRRQLHHNREKIQNVLFKSTDLQNIASQS